MDRWIFVFMAALFFVTALAGFIPDSLMKIAAVKAGERAPFPLVLHVHAVLMGAWLSLLLAQTTLMATGNAAMSSVNPFESVRTLAATIGAEMAEVVFGDTHYSVLFLIGALLFVFTFTLNAIAEFYIKGKLVKRFQGKS